MNREASALPASPNHTAVPSRARDRWRAVSGEGELSPAQTASHGEPVRATRNDGDPGARSWRAASSGATSFSSGYRTKICETLMLTGARMGSSLAVLLEPVLPDLLARVARLALPVGLVEAEVLAAVEARQALGRDDADLGLGVLEEQDEGGGGLEAARLGDDARPRGPACRLRAARRPVQEAGDLGGRQVPEGPQGRLGGVVGRHAAELLHELHRARLGLVVGPPALQQQRVDPRGLERPVAHGVRGVQLRAVGGHTEAREDLRVELLR